MQAGQTAERVPSQEWPFSVGPVGDRSGWPVGNDTDGPS